ncbi:hypothetical protein [Alkalimarinus alittae]|uniref:Uncharacterized protein n=1 Tax=Alkalimarinus alittae TaxID=2961619 RepID=A0ABY6N5H2_9ALTE|nr:hypothetical protein [Alkalimarinus alittae]UZE97285.1 hypothetical protein NKI27_05910 [Alkalimarinus alittae]
MFIGNPLVVFTVNLLCKQGKIDNNQRDKLIIKDKKINSVIAIFASIALTAYLLPQ